MKEFLAYINHMTHILRKELERIDDAQVDLQRVKMSIVEWSGGLKGVITHAKEDSHETIAKTRKDFHEKLGLLIQGEEQITMILIYATRPELEVNIAKIMAWAEGGPSRNRRRRGEAI
jgi:hypothetical protein